MATTMWLVFDVGCIECGEDSTVVGVYRTRDEAERAAEAYRPQDADGWGRPEWNGQHDVSVYPIEIPGG